MYALARSARPNAIGPISIILLRTRNSFDGRPLTWENLNSTALQCLLQIIHNELAKLTLKKQASNTHYNNNSNKKKKQQKRQPKHKRLLQNL